MSRNPLNDLAALGDYLREQRQSAQLSLRQLSDRAGVSNPYLSQIERGLKRPSAEILQQLAKGLEVSAETLYVKAGILDEHPTASADVPSVRRAISADPGLTARQKATLIDVYESFVGTVAARDEGSGQSEPPSGSPAVRQARRSTSTGSGRAAKGARPSATRGSSTRSKTTGSTNTGSKTARSKSTGSTTT
jgi:transcriptional regulator with XRE-family HTH domain